MMLVTDPVAPNLTRQRIPAEPAILTSTVGSYPVPHWLTAMPSESNVVDATRVVLDIQRQAGIDLPTDGELYRFDVDHPETNGMIEYFVNSMGGTRSAFGRREREEFAALKTMNFRARPAAVVDEQLSEGSLDLFSHCARAAGVAAGPLKFTITSPYMLARTLLDHHYGDFEGLLMGVAEVLAEQITHLPCACLQLDEANIPGNPTDGPLAARALNVVLDRIDTPVERAVHFCFGNYGGQTIQRGTWKALMDFLNQLHADHVVMELAHRPNADLDALKELDPRIAVGIGVVDVKVNQIETPEDIAGRLEAATEVLGPGRVRFVHPDCGFWMLQRSVADRKIAALVEGRDLFLGRA